MYRLGGYPLQSAFVPFSEFRGAQMLGKTPVSVLSTAVCVTAQSQQDAGHGSR